jgi:hypothetical protein
VASTDEIVFPSPDQIEGFWAFDKMHAPRPLHPLSQNLVMTTLSEGFTEAQAEYDCPIMASSKAVNHYFFMAFHPVPDESVIADRMTRYHDTLAAKVPTIGQRWNAEWMPEVVARNEAEKAASYANLSDKQLLAKLDEMTDWMRRMWYIHGHINFVLLSGAALCDMYDAEMQPSDPTESYQILQGHHTRSVDVSRGLWTLSRQGVQGQARRVPPRVRLAQRRRLRPGRQALAGEPRDPRGQHRHLHGARRRPGP